ncbi:MAG: bacillithiol biosynthesis BshC [Bacteroidetes bacterium]|nr:bacillithiol biosynthesis BshC [Bacteroidota bacterium]
MTTTTAPSLHTGLRRVPFDRMPAFPALFTTYCTDYDRLAAFYAGDWRRPEARRQAADRAAAHPRDRNLLADVLLEQNERWGLDHLTREHIEALRGHADAVIVASAIVDLIEATPREEREQAVREYVEVLTGHG